VRRHARTTEAGIVHVHGVDFVDPDTDTVQVLASWQAPAAFLDGPAPSGVEPPIMMNAPVATDPAKDLQLQSAAMSTRNTFPLQNSNATSVNPLLTVLGAAARFEGRFLVEESIEVQCQLEGDLQVGGTLVIGERGEVSADVSTVNAVIHGQFEGNLKATGSVELAATARVAGNIESNELVIAKGAVFTGTVSRSESAADQVADTRSVATQTPAILVVEPERQVAVTRAPLADVGGSRGRAQIELT
jgi:cytoskeletal protein CcmA (bactofilin family)